MLIKIGNNGIVYIEQVGGSANSTTLKAYRWDSSQKNCVQGLSEALTIKLYK